VSIGGLGAAIAVHVWLPCVITDQPNNLTVPSMALGALLVILHDADKWPLTVEATYRVWRHRVRVQEASVAQAEREKRRHGSVSVRYGTGRGEPQPDEEVHTVRIWRDGEKVREERHGGQRDGYYAVANPPLWWMWDERIGARSNEDDPTVGHHVGQDMELMLEPTSLLSSLRFQVTGTSAVAGRGTVTTHAIPRAPDNRFGPSIGLGAIGTGADYYELEVDAERGVLLAASAFRKGEPFHSITALAIQLGQRINPNVFRFKPPEGEEIQSTWDRPRLQSVTLVEAQQQAPFTVMMLDTVPTNWQVQCRLIEASKRRRSSTTVVVSYRSTDGHESISINQTAAGAPDRPGIGNEEDWETVTHGERTIKTRPASWGQAQARFESEGTYVNLMSDNLTRDQLVKIAAEMRPAPSTSSI
jgi:hypothetical protein